MRGETKPKRIPIKTAKEIGEKLDYDQVIITAWNKETGIYHITTWGKTIEDCSQAAEGGNFVKRALGWPEHLCNAKPSRLKTKGGNS